MTELQSLRHQLSLYQYSELAKTKENSSFPISANSRSQHRGHEPALRPPVCGAGPSGTGQLSLPGWALRGTPRLGTAGPASLKTPQLCPGRYRLYPIPALRRPRPGLSHFRRCLGRCGRRHGGDETEARQEDHGLLQEQLPVPRAFPGAAGRHLLPGGAPQQDPDPGAAARVPGGRGAALHHAVRPGEAGWGLRLAWQEVGGGPIPRCLPESGTG